jgi:hypothetical protein
VDSTPCALVDTVAEHGLVAAIGMHLSIVGLGMGREPGRRLALPPELHWEQPQHPPIITDTASAAIILIPPAIRASILHFLADASGPLGRGFGVRSKSKLLHHGTVNCCFIARSIHASRHIPAPLLGQVDQAASVSEARRRGLQLVLA